MRRTIACKCGLVLGEVREAQTLRGKHFICFCDDCQAYAHWLGHAREILDENGGTGVVPVFPARLKILSGVENIKCMRLSDKGIHRWYAGCCQTPIANSLDPKLGYIGLFVRALVVPNREELLGPVAARVMAQFGIPPLPKDARKGAPFKLVYTAIKGIIEMNFKRLKRPSPFFDSTTHKPISQPYVLSVEEREGLRKYCGPHPTAY